MFWMPQKEGWRHQTLNVSCHAWLKRQSIEASDWPNSFSVNARLAASTANLVGLPRGVPTDELCGGQGLYSKVEEFLGQKEFQIWLVITVMKPIHSFQIRCCSEATCDLNVFIPPPSKSFDPPCCSVGGLRYVLLLLPYVHMIGPTWPAGFLGCAPQRPNQQPIYCTYIIIHLMPMFPCLVHSYISIIFWRLVWSPSNRHEHTWNAVDHTPCVGLPYGSSKIAEISHLMIFHIWSMVIPLMVESYKFLQEKVEANLLVHSAVISGPLGWFERWEGLEKNLWYALDGCDSFVLYYICLYHYYILL